MCKFSNNLLESSELRKSQTSLSCCIVSTTFCIVLAPYKQRLTGCNHDNCSREYSHAYKDTAFVYDDSFPHPRHTHILWVNPDWFCGAEILRLAMQVGHISTFSFQVSVNRLSVLIKAELPSKWYCTFLVEQQQPSLIKVWNLRLRYILYFLWTSTQKIVPPVYAELCTFMPRTDVAFLLKQLQKQNRERQHGRHDIIQKGSDQNTAKNSVVRETAQAQSAGRY